MQVSSKKYSFNTRTSIYNKYYQLDSFTEKGRDTFGLYHAGGEKITSSIEMSESFWAIDNYSDNKLITGRCSDLVEPYIDFDWMFNAR